MDYFSISWEDLTNQIQTDPCFFQPVSPWLLVESGFLSGFFMWLNHVKSTFLLVKSLFYWLNPHPAGRIKKPRPVPRLGQHRFAAREFLDPKALAASVKSVNWGPFFGEMEVSQNGVTPI